MRCVCHPHGHVSIFLISTESNDITNIFCKICSCTKNAFTSIYDISMSPEHFEIKNKDLRPLQGLKIDSYKLCI